MTVYEAGEYVEINGDHYEVMESGWNTDDPAYWTMVLRPLDGRTYHEQVHTDKPVMGRGGVMPPKPDTPATH